MSTVPLSIAVTASAEVAFDFVADQTNEKDWNPAVVRSAQTSPGPIGVGSTFELVGKMMGREMVVGLKVTYYDQPRRITTLATSGPMTFHTTYEVVPDATGATVTMSVETVPSGPLRVLKPLIAAGFVRRQRRLMPGLKAVIDARSAKGPTRTVI